jgi:hypothetical protein
MDFQYFKEKFTLHAGYVAKNHVIFYLSTQNLRCFMVPMARLVSELLEVTAQTALGYIIFCISIKYVVENTEFEYIAFR